MSEQQKIVRTKIGIVVSNKTDKTCVIVIERNVKHSQYGKYIKRTTKLHVHDENNECGIGDRIAIVPSRPMSKLKHWKLVKIIEKAKG